MILNILAKTLLVRYQIQLGRKTSLYEFKSGFEKFKEKLSNQGKLNSLLTGKKISEQERFEIDLK